MKKLISLLLVLTMILGLCACGSSEPEEEKPQLLIGYGRENITPDDNVPLGGYGQTQNRISTAFIDILYSTCIAITEGEETVLIYNIDLINSRADWVDLLRDSVNKEIGISMDRIFVNCSHTHSAPDMASADSRIATYKTKFIRNSVKAAKAALEDQAPATLYSTKTKTEDLNFVREYILEDGRKGTGATFIASGTPVAHMEENDPEMILVKADREGDKKDILMMNWQAHPCTTGGMTKYNISADFIASVREELEFETDMHFAYYTGAAGNQNTGSEIEGEVSKANGKKSATKETLGRALAETAMAALPDLQPVEGSGVKVSQIDYEYPYNHEDEDKAADARKVVDLWASDGHAAADKLAVQLGFHTVYHASAVIARTSRAPSGTMELVAVRVGGIGFAFAPCEMYASIGRYIKDNSPYETTLVLSCANESLGYFPTIESYEVGTYGSTTSTFQKGCAEASAEKLVSMLTEIK